MSIRYPNFSRLLPIVFVSAMPACALAAYLPNWTQQSYNIYQDIQGGENASQYTDITVGNISVPIVETLVDNGTGSSASGTSSLGYAGGVFTAVLSPSTTSTNASTSPFGYALSSAGIDNRFIADTTMLYLDYTIRGSMYANNPNQDLNYAALAAGFFVEDVLLGFGSRQTFAWANLYDDDATGNFSYTLNSASVSTIQLTPGRTYRFALDLTADTLSTGTSDAGVPVTFSFSFRNAAATVPEPQGIALLALGLIGLAGTRTIRRRQH